MDMEAWFFAILMGLWLAALFIGIGVIIGKLHSSYNQKCNKDDSGDVREGIDYSSIHNSRTNYVCTGPMGDVYREIDSGRDMGSGCYKEGRITEGCAIVALKTIRRDLNKTLCQIEKDALDYFIEKGEEE